MLFNVVECNGLEVMRAMATAIKTIDKVSVTIPDESGNYTISVWLRTEDTPDQQIYIEGVENTGSTALEDALNSVLTDNGYDAV